MQQDLNTKADYFNFLTIQPEETKRQLQLLLDTRFYWKTTAILAKEDEGLNDETHRVIGEEPERMQQEYAEDPNAKLFRIGFTVDEVKEIIKK